MAALKADTYPSIRRQPHDEGPKVIRMKLVVMDGNKLRYKVSSRRHRPPSHANIPGFLRQTIYSVVGESRVIVLRSGQLCSPVFSPTPALRILRQPSARNLSTRRWFGNPHRHVDGNCYLQHDRLKADACFISSIGIIAGQIHIQRTSYGNTMSLSSLAN